MKTPILNTERLLLRPLTVLDGEEIYKNWTSDPEVARYMRWSVHSDPQVTKEWLAMEEQNLESSQVFTWGFVRRDTGELIGSGGILYKEEKEMFELGYNIMKKYWNMGFTTEAAGKIVEFAITELGEKQLFCCHAKENTASGHVMRKAGFRYVKEGSYSSFDLTRTYITDEYCYYADRQ